MHGPRPQPRRQRKSGRPVKDEQREILVLIEVAVKETQDLLAMRRIIGRIQIEDDMRRRRPPRAQEQLRQIVVEDAQPLAEGSVDLPQHRPFCQRQLGLPPRIGMVKAIQGRAARQGPVVVRRHADQSLEQGIVAQHLGVVAIGIAGEDLIDILRENGFAGVAHQLLGARVGKS